MHFLIVSPNNSLQFLLKTVFRGTVLLEMLRDCTSNQRDIRKQMNLLKQNFIETLHFVTRIFTNDANQGIKTARGQGEKSH